ncbi:MAG: class I SAM-dependent methyltransferase [Acidobacteria bacterium]|nr:class I SAM-dependent methyltransferase [Acidobacteriota bacterium]
MRTFDAPGDHLDLRPRDPHAEQTKYLDEALHADPRHATTAPPLLSAAIRNDMLRKFLRPAPGDRIIDLGCGSGRVLIWNGGAGAYQVGVDVSPYFSREARGSVDLVLGDLRQLPFDDASFTKAYALDVLEHLSRDSLGAMLREVSRVLTPGGQLFVYSHVRKNSLVAAGLKAINRLARALERRGLVDLEHERLRKSDHLNPLADIPDFRNTTAAAGFEVARLRYYTPLVGGVVENILVRVGEQLVRRFSSSWLPASGGRTVADLPPNRLRQGYGGQEGGSHEDSGGSHKDMRAAIKQRIARRGPTYVALRGLTLAMKVDLVLFGRIESGPFFALLRKKQSA